MARPATIPPVTEHSLAEQPFAALLDAFVAARPAPGGGSAAALSAAIAAALAERCAAAAGRERSEDARRAASLRRRLLDLADDDALALRGLVQAFAEERDPDARAAAIAAATEPAERLRDAAADVAALAASLERRGARQLRGEARCAMLLADAAVGAADAIIRLNDQLADLT